VEKKPLTKSDIRTKFITPGFVGKCGAKRRVMTHLCEQLVFTQAA
jgi:hypothetical protein